MSGAERIFAACAPGLEEILAAELGALGLAARPVPGGAEASGRDAVALACLAARVADAVALRLFDGPARGVEGALAGARHIHGPVAPLAVRYEPQDNLILEVHSHRDGLARFSATDSADEQRLRLYGVVGRLDQSIPQVALRAGAYGYFLPVPWDAVFDGDNDSIEDVLDAADLRLAQERFEGWLEPGA